MLLSKNQSTTLNGDLLFLDLSLLHAMSAKCVLEINVQIVRTRTVSSKWFAWSLRLPPKELVAYAYWFINVSFYMFLFLADVPGFCYTSIKSGMCAEPLERLTRRTECCCVLVGQQQETLGKCFAVPNHIPERCAAVGTREIFNFF